MLKGLKNLRCHNEEVAKANDLLELVTAPYDEQIGLALYVLNKIKRARDTDPDVQRATRVLEEVESRYALVQTQTKQAVVAYWEEFGFETGKKSVIMEGCRLNIRETTNRQVINPDLMVLAAREDGVYAKVIQRLRPVLNRAAFNAWVDLKDPLGVETIHTIAATVTILEE